MCLKLCPKLRHGFKYEKSRSRALKKRSNLMSTIITHRQFPGYHKYEMELAGRPLM